MLKSIDHIVITTRDLEKCVDFYPRVLDPIEISEPVQNAHFIGAPVRRVLKRINLRFPLSLYALSHA
ncbi:MAG: hypothetical protein K2Y16_03645 [Burkholderiales bacterium]|nr:hypothetical protein [Burkholderiales bacterium]